MSGRRKVLVTGATGFAGPAVLRALEGRADIVAGGRDLVDVADAGAVAELVRGLRPDAVIHLAVANTGSAPEAMTQVNVVGAGNVARACAAVEGVRLVNISTDVIHDGTAAPYADDAEPSPLHDYGRTKAAGEAAVLQACPGAVSVRPSLVWDPDRIDRTNADFRRQLREGRTLSLWTDVLRQPIHADDLAALLVLLALDEREVTGTVNAGGAQVLSRHGLGTRLLRHFGAPGVGGIAEATAPPGVPTDLRLRTDLLDEIGLRARGVDEVLRAG